MRLLSNYFDLLLSYRFTVDLSLCLLVKACLNRWVSVEVTGETIHSRVSSALCCLKTQSKPNNFYMKDINCSYLFVCWNRNNIDFIINKYQNGWLLVNWSMWSSFLCFGSANRLTRQVKATLRYFWNRNITPVSGWHNWTKIYADLMLNRHIASGAEVRVCSVLWQTHRTTNSI